MATTGLPRSDTRLKIIRLAAELYLDQGYSKTSNNKTPRLTTSLKLKQMPHKFPNCKSLDEFIKLRLTMSSFVLLHPF